MKIIKYILFTVIFFVISCNNFDVSFLKLNINKLELDRRTTLNTWKTTFNDPDYQSLKPEVIRAMGRCRNLSYLPFFKKLFVSQISDSSLKEVIFAMGQLKSIKANEALINLDFGKYDLNTKKSILKAIVNVPDNTVKEFIEYHLNSFELKNSTFHALAILARNKIYSRKARVAALDSISLKNPNTDIAYFMYYSSRDRHLKPILEMVNNAHGYTLNLLLKTAAKLTNNNDAQIKNILESDSLLRENFSKKYHSILSSDFNGWATQLYAIKCFPSIADSAYLPRIQSLASAENPHLRIAANASLMSFSREMQSFLLKNIHQEKSMFVKSELIKLLAQSFPTKAYFIIQENLSKGDIYFKANLLEALGSIKTRRARLNLRGYLQVPNSLLANRAFSLLDGRKALQVSDVELMLHRDEKSSRSLAIDWYSSSKYRLEPQKLIDLFTSSSDVANLDIQRSILNYFKAKKLTLDPVIVERLVRSSCFYQVTDSLTTMFPDVETEDVHQPCFILPVYLNIDSLDYDSRPRVKIQTKKGDIILELNPRIAPFTVMNFLKLAQNGFYDGLYFHRVVVDFVIQGGDPTGDGWGGPGYLIPSEDNVSPFTRGSVGIATSGYDTGGSQFFICQSPQPHLTGNYTLFGHVINGLDIIDFIEPGDKIIQISMESK